MKMLASLVALAALGVFVAPSPAIADRSAHAHVSGSHVVILQHRPVVVVPGSPFLVARPRQLFLSRPIIVQRPFVPAQPMIVQPQLVVPRNGAFFTTPNTTIIIVR
jgi:hypothetical protein